MKNKMRFVCVLLLMISMTGMLFAQASYEQRKAAEEGAVTVRLAVMQGPTGFSSIGLSRDGGVVSDNVTVELSVYPSPNEVIARLASGELDMAALPANTAANLYNKGVAVKAAAVVGEGMLKVLSSDAAIHGVSDLVGKTLAVPGANGTPDQMAQMLIRAAGLAVDKDIVLDYSVAAPAQLAQMVIGGKVATAILPEPFVTMILKQNPNVRVVADVQSLWSEMMGSENYPMSVLVVSDSFRTQYPYAWRQVVDAYKDSVAWVNASPAEAGAAIEAAGIMKAAMAVPAIPSCALVFRSAQDAKGDMQTYFKTLFDFSPNSIGGKLPDEAFYL